MVCIADLLHTQGIWRTVDNRGAGRRNGWEIEKGEGPLGAVPRDTARESYCERGTVIFSGFGVKNVSDSIDKLIELSVIKLLVVQTINRIYF